MTDGSILPLIEQSQQLPGVVQVVACHAAEAERVEVAEGDGGERHGGGRDLVQLGDVRVLQVQVYAVHAHAQQHSQRAEEEEQPGAALDAQALVAEDVRQAVQGGAVGEHLQRRWRLTEVHVLGIYLEVHFPTPHPTTGCH